MAASTGARTVEDLPDTRGAGHANRRGGLLGVTLTLQQQWAVGTARADFEFWCSPVSGSTSPILDFRLAFADLRFANQAHQRWALAPG